VKAIGKLCSEFSDFLSVFDKLPFDETARQTRFVKRKPRKITPRNFLLGLIQSVLGDGKALRNIAIHIGAQIEDTVAKQSVDERITDECLVFLETTLLQALLQRCQSKREWIKNTALAQHFRRVLVQDSTTIALPPKLVADFPGPRNKFGQHACAKIQAIIDLLREQYCAFELSPYTKNDQAAAHDIFATARAGDLVLRDLGYFALAVLKQMLEKGIYFLSRFRHGIAIFEADGVTPFDLLKALRQSDVLDQTVCIGAKEKVPVRLIAQPVSPEVAAERRRKARADRDRRKNHDAAYFKLLGWDIFVTNIPTAILTAQQVARIHPLRWRVEIVFKSWKSQFEMNQVPQVKDNPRRIKAHVYAALIFITLCHHNLFAKLSKRKKKAKQPEISLLKFSQFVKEFAVFLAMPPDDKWSEWAWLQISYHCRYERRERKNYPQLLASLA
jgi:hypothetical protein